MEIKNKNNYIYNYYKNLRNTHSAISTNTPTCTIL